MLLHILLLAVAAPQETPFAWMVGSWCTRPNAPLARTTCEEWRPIAGGGLRGVSKTQHERMTVLDEAMEIRRDGNGWVFHAEPHGQAAADFRAAANDVAARAVTFVNAGHDYPQRIRYWRDGDRLMAEIAMADGSKPVTWEYHRVE